MLEKMLDSDMIQVNQSANTWREALLCSASPLVSSNRVDEEYVESMIKTVQELGPYMILLPEVAFFHGPPSDHVKEICLSLTLFKEKVVFEEWKGVEIKAAFAFGAKDKESHMELLSQLAMLLQDETFIELLRTNASKEEVLRKINTRR